MVGYSARQRREWIEPSSAWRWGLDNSPEEEYQRSKALKALDLKLLLKALKLLVLLSVLLT